MALSAGFILPSWLEVAVKISELFIRMNTVRDDDRWSHLGRLMMTHQVGLVVCKRNLVNKDPDTGSRFQRAAAHAVNHFEWKMILSEDTRRSRVRHLFDRDPVVSAILGSANCSSVQTVQLTGGSTKVAHDCWTGWEVRGARDSIHVYTDGSHAPDGKDGPTSSWAVTVGDEWLNSNFGSVPSDERLLTPAHVGGATLFGASIENTSGIYPQSFRPLPAPWPCFHSPPLCTFTRTVRLQSLEFAPTPLRSTSGSGCAWLLDLYSSLYIINSPSARQLAASCSSSTFEHTHKLQTFTLWAIASQTTRQTQFDRDLNSQHQSLSVSSLLLSASTA